MPRKRPAKPDVAQELEKLLVLPSSAYRHHLRRAMIALREIAECVEAGTLHGPAILFSEPYVEDLRARAAAIERFLRSSVGRKIA